MLFFISYQIHTHTKFRKGLPHFFLQFYECKMLETFVDKNFKEVIESVIISVNSKMKPYNIFMKCLIILSAHVYLDQDEISLCCLNMFALKLLMP